MTARRPVHALAVLASALAALCANAPSPAAAADAGAAAFTPSAKLLGAPKNRIGVHSMLYQTTPLSAKEEMFAQARGAGASFIRVDLALSAIFIRGEVRGQVFHQERWPATDQYATLANRHGVRVLAVLYGTPPHIAACPAGVRTEDAYHCPPADAEAYREMVAKVAARYAGVIDHFEIINEPDTARAFYGTPAQYARTLAVAADAIHVANPAAKVAIGGVSTIENTAFTDAVLAADPSLAAKIDIPTMHLRSSASGAAKLAATWRAYYDAKGIRGPLWLTEYGYPAARAFQYDPLFQAGEQAQAKFLEVSMPWVVGAGGDKLFITERDWGGGAFASEGILESPDPLPAAPRVRRRAAFETVRRAAASLEAAFPPGRSEYAQPPGSRVRVRRGRIAVLFTCPTRGDCPSRSVRLALRGGGAYGLKTPTIRAGRRASARVRLTRTTLRRVRRAGRGGLPATVTDPKNQVLGTIAIVR